MSGMSQEKVLKALESFGLAKVDAQIYIFLGKKGPQKAMEILKALKIRRQRLYDSLKNLEGKGIVSATLEHPAKFSALPFEKALDLFVKAKIDEARRIEGGKDELFSDWQKITVAQTADQSPKFSVLEGRNFIYPRLRQMIEETKSQLSIVSTVSGLARADNFGLLDAAASHASETSTKYRFLTELSEDNLRAIRQLLKRIPKGSAFEGRTPETGIKLTSRMLIRDNCEAAFFLGQEANTPEKESDEACLWTNSSTIVNSFTAVFEDIWQNSTKIENRITEIETGKPSARIGVVSDPEEAKSKYYELIGSAKTEILMVTSPAGLIDAWKNTPQLKNRAENGISVKIMAPIVTDNLDAALRLSDFCRVRHVPADYLGTTIVDSQHLFQFKSPAEIGKLGESPSFESVFYTNDREYVEKTKSILDAVWKNAVAPSSVTIEQINKPRNPSVVPVSDDERTLSKKDSPYRKGIIDLEEKPDAITEEYVLNKMFNAKRVPAKWPWREPVTLYGSDAGAVIHPPTSFNLPPMLLNFFHFNKKSAPGAEDSMFVQLWLDTPIGKAFVPVAIAGDNPRSVERWKIIFAGTPSCKNIHILRKDELQIQVHGNTLFAAWAVSIPLLPLQYILPPGGLLVEGYGKVKAAIVNLALPSGAKSIMEGNGLDAFVTFFHPASKYAGPGTDGTFGREIIMTNYPPPMLKSKTTGI